MDQIAAHILIGILLGTLVAGIQLMVRLYSKFNDLHDITYDLGEALLKSHNDIKKLDHKVRVSNNKIIALEKDQ